MWRHAMTKVAVKVVHKIVARPFFFFFVSFLLLLGGNYTTDKTFIIQLKTVKFSEGD